MALSQLLNECGWLMANTLSFFLRPKKHTMKKLLLLILLAPVAGSQAQLLKKIKDKAQQAMEPKKSSETNTPPGSSESSSQQERSKEKWTPGPNDQKVFTLESGETFLYDETRVFAKDGKISYAFVLMNKKYQYFLVEDGKRSGPFATPPVEQLYRNAIAQVGDGEEDNKINIGSDQRDPVAQQYSKTINNKLFIVFKGKNYGPYDYIAKMVVSPDEKKFWAAVVVGGMSELTSKMGMGNVLLVNDAGVNQKTPSENGMPAKFYVSNSFTAAAVSILDNINQKVFTVSSSGKTTEGNMTDLYNNDKSFTSVADNGDIISVPSQSPRQLLVNGEEAAVFKVPVTNLSRLFIMPDYKKSAFYQGGKIYRGDESEEALTGVVFPKLVAVGKDHLICYYKIHETENGAKDVYLCKKNL